MAQQSSIPLRRNFLVLFLLITGIIGAGFFFGLRYSAASGIAERKSEIRRNLNRMLLALTTYAQNNAGAFPDDIVTLFPKYVSDPEIFVNPSWPDEIGYMYVTGVCTGSVPDSSDTLLIFENVPPEKRKLGRLVVQLDGKVEQLTEPQFQERLTALKARWSEQKRDLKLAPVDPGKILDKK